MNSSLLAKGISHTFLIAGGLVFLVGDKALREIWNITSVPAEVIGIGGGLALMLLGAAIRFRQPKPDQNPE